MTDEQPMLSNAELEALFAEARETSPELSSALRARLVSDATIEHRSRQMKEPERRRSRLFEWLAWPAGLTAACAAGLWIGLSSEPDVVLALDDVWNSDLGVEFAFRMPGLAGTVAGY